MLCEKFIYNLEESVNRDVYVMKQKNGLCLIFCVLFGLSILSLNSIFYTTDNSCNIENSPIAALKDESGINAQNIKWETVVVDHKLKLRLWVDNITVTSNTIFGNPQIGSFVKRTDLMEFRYIIKDMAQNIIRKSDDFSYNETTHCFYADVEMTSVPETTTMKIITNFTYNDNSAYSREESNNFEFRHQAVISVKLRNNPGTSFLTLDVNAYDTFTGIEIINSTATMYNYSIFKKDGGSTPIAVGNLTYSTEFGSWSANVDVLRKMGDFYAVVTFKSINMAYSTTTENTWQEGTNLATRPFTFTDYLEIIIGLGIGGVILFTILIMKFTKKKEQIVERPKADAKKPLEIVEISKDSLKIQKLDPKSIKKVKKLDDKGLIFNVPTWEVEEEEMETTATGASASTVVSTSYAGFTLHCPGCNSWYEVDEYEKLDCPKCGKGLEVAMWCVKCQKWFDVPKPMEVNCPKCTQKLQYGK
jgi:Zn finger protein HypA/HybF involved in hydrogenase expression